MANLDCLVCGPVPPNPSELLSSDRMQTLIREAMAEYQFVLVDAPPLLNVADGRISPRWWRVPSWWSREGSLHASWPSRRNCIFATSGAHLIGVVLNDVDVRHNGYYKGYYKYGGYGESKGSAEKN